jgi:hypothetical protein
MLLIAVFTLWSLWSPGVHAHVGSSIHDPENWLRVGMRLRDVVSATVEGSRASIDFLGVTVVCLCVLRLVFRVSRPAAIPPHCLDGPWRWYWCCG